MHPFTVPFGGTTLFGERWTPARPVGTALLLHGGGGASVARFEALLRCLHSHCIDALAFDFIGHGRTGGAMLGTTLNDRVRQVHAVMEAQQIDARHLTLAGFSMGAYVAAQSAVACGVPRLCLAIPAAYAPEALCLPFGPEFSRVLRAPRSWARSDAFPLMRDYPGHLLVVSAENDQVVPAEIPQQYASSPSARASTTHHRVQGAAHDLNAHFEREPQARAAAYAEIVSLCLRA